MASRERSVVTAQNRSRKGLCWFRLRPGGVVVLVDGAMHAGAQRSTRTAHYQSQTGCQQYKIPVFCHVERGFGLGVVPVFIIHGT